MSVYFHCAPIPLAAGSVILPGNWGRIIRLYQPNQGNHAIAFRERVMEDVRVAEFPEKPSRLECVFALPTLDQALYYRSQPSNAWSLLYEVELVDPASLLHVGDWRFGYAPNQIYTFDGTADIARKYWRGEDVVHSEVLIAGPLRVLRRIDTPPPMLP